jgi:hypothetical protein
LLSTPVDALFCENEISQSRNTSTQSTLGNQDEESQFFDDYVRYFEVQLLLDYSLRSSRYLIVVSGRERVRTFLPSKRPICESEDSRSI